MAKLSAILSQKGTQVLSVGPDSTVLDAATLMNEHRVGALVVTQNGVMKGMFTERDVLRRVVAERRDPASTRVRDVMTTDVVVCDPDASIDDARSIMMQRRIRHLPVIETNGAPMGLISIGDLNAWELDGQERTIHVLNEYLYGRA